MINFHAACPACGELVRRFMTDGDVAVDYRELNGFVGTCLHCRAGIRVRYVPAERPRTYGDYAVELASAPG